MWNNLEHAVWKKLKVHNLQDRETFLLAVSGGLDSMVLARVFKVIKPKAQLILMYFHHGEGENQDYRDGCQELVKDMSSTHTIEVSRAESRLNSEDEFRQARLDFFKSVQQKYHQNFYLTAHHQDDVLETQLLKLIRGTGLQGLKAFQEWNGEIFRPFFDVKKQVLRGYAEDLKIDWLDDPTNRENRFLRNWIRNQWLPDLESKAQGAAQVLAQSINNIILENSGCDRYDTESARYVKIKNKSICIDRLWLGSFNTKDQISVLIRAIKEAFPSNFRTSQIKEALRRLDQAPNEKIFSVAGINWVINASEIVLSLKAISQLKVVT